MALTAKSLARAVKYLLTDDPRSLGLLLRSELAPEQRRALVGYLLSREDPSVTLHFSADGTAWTVPAGDIITADLYATGGYQGSLVEGLIDWVREHRGPLNERVAVDLGANVGTTTIRLASAYRRVVAVEPVAATYDFLKTNVEQNGLGERVIALEAAVAATAGPVRMSSESHGSSHLDDEGTIVVDGAPLPHLLARAGVVPSEVGLVWSDTEGTEPVVIDTGAELWTAGVPLLAEVYDGRLAEKVADHFYAFIRGADLAAAGGNAPAHHVSKFAELALEGDVLLVA